MHFEFDFLNYYFYFMFKREDVDCKIIAINITASHLPAEKEVKAL